MEQQNIVNRLNRIEKTLRYIQENMKEIDERMKEFEKRIEKLNVDVEDLYGLVFGKIESNITCNKCNYSWLTRTKLRFISCPNCGAKVKRLSKNERKQKERLQEKESEKRAKECINATIKRNKKYPSNLRELFR